MRMSQFIKCSKDLTDFLIDVGFTLKAIEIEKNQKTKEILKKIKYVRSIEDQEITFDLRLKTICKSKISLLSASLYRNNKSGVIYLPLLLEQLASPAVRQNRILKLNQLASIDELKFELQQYKELLSGHLKATIDGKEWKSVYLHSQDY